MATKLQNLFLRQCTSELFLNNFCFTNNYFFGKAKKRRGGGGLCDLEFPIKMIFHTHMFVYRYFLRQPYFCGGPVGRERMCEYVGVINRTTFYCMTIQKKTTIKSIIIK